MTAIGLGFAAMILGTWVATRMFRRGYVVPREQGDAARDARDQESADREHDES